LTAFESFVKRQGGLQGGIYPNLEEIEISESLQEMYLIRKHYFIMTDAGKPIYSRYGDEQTLAPFFATFAAIIPKIQNYFWNGDDDIRTNKNRVHCFTACTFKCHILKKSSLIYICMINQRKKSNIGYFLDDLSQVPIGNRTDSAKHILTQELLPNPCFETASYVKL